MENHTASFTNDVINEPGMAPRLKALAVLPENQSSVSSAHTRQLTTLCDPSSRDPKLPSSGLYKHPHKNKTVLCSEAGVAAHL